MGPQTGFDIAKAFSMCELGKRHDQVLIETTEPFYIMVSLVPGDASAKGVHWQVSYDLRENKLACIHDPPLLNLEAEQSGIRSGDSSR